MIRRGLAQDARELLSVAGSWGATLSPDGRRTAYISDRGGWPQVWVQAVAGTDAAAVIDLGPDPVVQVRWSADGEWLSCALAPGGGVKTHAWAVRPNGADARRLAGEPGEHVAVGPWSPRGAHLVIAEAAEKPDADEMCELVDPVTGTRRELARGHMVTVLDISLTERFALLRDGPRGARFCVVLDRAVDADHPLLPYPGTGSTDAGILRPPPERVSVAGDHSVVAYLISDTGRARPVLLAVGIRADGQRGPVGMLAWRDDADLELITADDPGRTLALVWNRSGRSDLELLDTRSGERRLTAALPGDVISSCEMSRDGSTVVCTIESPTQPREVWALAVKANTWTRVTDANPGRAMHLDDLVAPTLERFISHDGLPIEGWLYRGVGETDGRALIWFHGGPEAQERPTFSPLFQSVARSGIALFAPNVRGSSGYGRAFVHADDGARRYAAIDDVAMCVRHLVDIGAARRGRVACSGRSYGGYLTLAAMVRYPKLFAAGIDICGMSDLLTFYRDTEPWIAASAASKYGDPDRDAALLADLSPLRRIELMAAPLLVIHGELDTNVPYSEATQVVAALTALGRPVELLSFPDEGHEYRRVHSRIAQAQTIVGFLQEHLVR
ncbi:MAG: peptidase [Pseudonocardiales bacterium]|nr:peptidase [Pseudonocardiales bacterium]